MRAWAVAAVAAALLVGCGSDPEPQVFEGTPEEQVVATLAAYNEAFGAGDGETACAQLTDYARQAMVKVSEEGTEKVGSYDAGGCADAVESFGEGDLPLSGIDPSEIAINPDGTASYTLRDSNAVVLVPDGEAWLLAFPFPTGR